MSSPRMRATRTLGVRSTYRHFPAFELLRRRSGPAPMHACTPSATPLPTFVNLHSVFFLLCPVYLSVRPSQPLIEHLIKHPWFLVVLLRLLGLLNLWLFFFLLFLALLSVMLLDARRLPPKQHLSCLYHCRPPVLVFHRVSTFVATAATSCGFCRYCLWCWCCLAGHTGVRLSLPTLLRVS